MKSDLEHNFQKSLKQIQEQSQKQILQERKGSLSQIIFQNYFAGILIFILPSQPYFNIIKPRLLAICQNLFRLFYAIKAPETYTQQKLLQTNERSTLNFTSTLTKKLYVRHEIICDIKNHKAEIFYVQTAVNETSVKYNRISTTVRETQKFRVQQYLC
eukprot:TRINITY_DN6337_c0_g1_i2.p2 TRINITY_DN6337_c0_g1~~TRINITY_DN6337_c0_g1_i2.p2  ORF type:complete len:158 (-),score=4.05 TRINITY_DN6337_c0_g1_i2:603-1076(-)